MRIVHINQDRAYPFVPSPATIGHKEVRAYVGKLTGSRPPSSAVRAGLPAGFFALPGYRDHFDDPSVLARAYALRSLLTEHVKHVYDGDRIAGSIRGLLGPLDPATMEHAARVVNSYGRNTFATNADHFAPDYAGFLARGIRGVRQAIDDSRLRHGAEQERLLFLEAAEVAIDSLGLMIGQYAEAADRAAERTGSAELRAVADACRAVCWEPPQTFRQALQLVWLTHVAFLYEGRYAMALGRLDQYLYPFYREDVRRGRLTPDEALDLMCHTLYKIGESRLFGGDDVVNICIGGLTPTGEDATNELSDIILEAVCRCNIPGPNLSARIHAHTSPEFLDRCLRVIGTGLGYPALMNDEVNIPALQRHGYSLEDSRDYCMVGCIENFIPGKQPPLVRRTFQRAQVPGIGAKRRLRYAYRRAVGTPYRAGGIPRYHGIVHGRLRAPGHLRCRRVYGPIPK